MRLFRIALFCLMFSAATAFSDDAVTAKISGHMSGSNGVIGISTPQKVRFKAEASGDTLIITFESAVDAQLFPLLSGLRDIVSKASLTADKKQILVDLKMPCQAKVTLVGENSEIQLIPAAAPKTQEASKPASPPQPAATTSQSAAAAPAEQPKTPEPLVKNGPVPPMIGDIYKKAPDAKRNKLTDVVEVSATPYEGNVEIRFKWPRNVEYRIFQKPDHILIEFDDSAPSMPPKITKELKPFFKDISNRTLDGHLLYTFTFQSASSFSHHKEENDVVMDITPAGTAKAKQKQQEQKAVETAQTKTDKTDKQEKPAAAPEKPATRAETSEIAVSTISVPGKTAGDGKSITPEHKIENGVESISFPWSQDVAAAMFSRGRQGWIIFNQPVKANISKLMRSKSEFIENINASEGQNYTMFSFRFKKLSPAHMEKNGTEWKVLFASASNNIQPTIEKTESKNGSEAVITVRKPANPVNITDDATGQIIQLIPLPDAGIATPKERSFVDFNLLKTSQGVAIEILNDQLDVSTGNDGIHLRTGHGLNLSSKDMEAPPAQTAQPPPEQQSPKQPPVVAEAPQKPQPEAKKTEPEQPQQQESAKPPEPAATAKITDTSFLTQDGNSFLPYDLWKTPARVSFHDVLMALNHDQSDNPADQRASSRTRKTRFFMAESMFPEGLAELDLLKQSNPDYMVANHLYALDGIGQFMLGNYKEALADFLRPELAGKIEADLWRKIATTADGSISAPISLNQEQIAAISSYPESVRRKISFLLADKFIMDKNYDAAEAFLSLAAPDKASVTVRQRADIYRGMMAKRKNDYSKAEKIFEQLSSSDDRMISASALLNLVECQLEKNEIKTDDAIKKLEPLLIKWRGDDIEMNAMRLLAQLYINNGQYREGMETLRTLVSNFPNSPVANDAAQLMNSTFIDLFTNGKADPMPPIDALSLYYEFRELTPLNRDGDIMVQKLADRMVQVDLLERAAALLSHQVKYRISGAERARVATRLAYIYLRNDKPEQALDALDTTEKEAVSIPPEASDLRRHLRVEALTRLKKYNDGLRLLENDDSPTGQRLALEILWNMQDWPHAEEYLKTILAAQQIDGSKPISTGIAEQIMRLALVYQFTNNNDGLKSLRTKFDGVMQKSPYADSFRFITEPLSKVNQINISKLEGMMKQFGTVMKELDSKVKDTGLSKAIP